MRLGVLLNDEYSDKALVLLQYSELTCFHELITYCLDTMMEAFLLETENE